MTYPASGTYYNAPDIHPEHYATFADRLGRHPLVYGAIYEALKSEIDPWAIGGMSLEELQLLHDAAFDDGFQVLDTVPVSTDDPAKPPLIHYYPAFVIGEPFWDDIERYNNAVAGRNTYAMFNIALVLQLKRWTSFGKHGGRPPNT